MTKVWVALLAAVFIVIAAAKIAYSISVDPGNEPVQEAWAQNKIEFLAWNNEKWTAWIHDGEFELVPEDKQNWSRHSNPSIAFSDWHGESWQAKIDGDEFLLAADGNWTGEVERADAIRYQDWSGNKQIRTVAELER